VAGVEQYASPVLKGRTTEVEVMIPEPPGLNGTKLLNGKNRLGFVPPATNQRNDFKHRHPKETTMVLPAAF
jgi:hypothetical protein